MSDEKNTFTPPPLKGAQRYLKNIKSHRVFLHTDELAKRGDMIPCDNLGNLLKGHVGSTDLESREIRKSKYIGFMVNGIASRLFLYTEQLAAKAGAIPVDSADEWQGDTSNVVALTPNLEEKAVKATKAAPVLSRDATSKEDDLETAETDTVIELVVPDVSAIEDEKEAKDILKAWAHEAFDVQLDGRLGVKNMVGECEAMLTAFKEEQSQATAG